MRSFAASAVSFGLVLLRVSSVPQCLRGGFCFWVLAVAPLRRASLVDFGFLVVVTSRCG